MRAAGACASAPDRGPAAVLRTSAGTELPAWDDDGFGIKATLKGAGRTVTTSAAGKASTAKYKRGTRVAVAAPGYAPTSFPAP